MEYEDLLIRESVGDGTIDPDDVCLVCEKRDCVCPPEESTPVDDLMQDVISENLPVQVPADAKGSKQATVRLGTLGEAREAQGDSRGWHTLSCSYCEAHKGDSMMPPHTPSQHCESGKRPHCTCDICY